MNFFKRLSNWRPRFTLWSLLCLVVLIGAGMGLYAKREPWRMVWKIHEPVNLQCISDVQVAKDQKSLAAFMAWTEPPADDVPEMAYIDLETRKVVPVRREVAGNRVNCMLSPDGTKAGYLDKGAIHEYYLAYPDGRENALISLSEESGKSVAFRFAHFSRDGRYVAVGFDGTVRLYESFSGTLLAIWERVVSRLVNDDADQWTALERIVSFHPTENKILINYESIYAEEWDLTPNASLKTWHIPPDQLNKDSRYRWRYLQDGSVLRETLKKTMPTSSFLRAATVTNFEPTGEVKWEYTSNERMTGEHGLFEKGLVYESTYKPNERTLYDAHTQKALIHFNTTVQPFAFPDGKRIIAGKGAGTNWWSSQLVITDVNSGKEIGEINNEPILSHLPKVLAVLNDDQMLLYDGAYELYLYERIRPEWWWGWFYLVETYIALAAFFSLLIPIFRKKA